jgi:putative solute:sodium symporter small subunit
MRLAATEPPNGTPLLSPLTPSHRHYWRKTLSLTSVLLMVWFVLTFGVTFFARDLSFVVFGWPIGFWMAAQGALVFYVLIVGVYAWAMHRLDASHEVDED